MISRQATLGGRARLDDGSALSAAHSTRWRGQRGPHSSRRGGDPRGNTTTRVFSDGISLKTVLLGTGALGGARCALLGHVRPDRGSLWVPASCTSRGGTQAPQSCGRRCCEPAWSVPLPLRWREPCSSAPLKRCRCARARVPHCCADAAAATRTAGTRPLGVPTPPTPPAGLASVHDSVGVRLQGF
jgi:hypothetical protein